MTYTLKFRSTVWLLAVSFASLMVGCGTTSELHHAPTALSKKFEKVYVAEVVTKNATTDEMPERVELAGKELRGMMVSQIRNTGAFSEVLTEGAPEADTLIIESEVTKYENGNAVARLMVGFGAGSSRFDAHFEALDGATKKPFGDMFADKNSWFLGGGLAAGQDADSYIPGIAKKVAKEIAPFGVNYTETL